MNFDDLFERVFGVPHNAQSQDRQHHCAHNPRSDGADIVGDDKPRAQGAFQNQSSAPKISVAIACPSCRADNLVMAKVCQQCGEVLSVRILLCAKCGLEMPSLARFCVQCGNAL